MTLLYFYISIFTIYFIVLTIAAAKSSKRIRDKYTPKDSNICVVIYATGVSETLENLIKQLKNQVYPKNCYTIYTILDKCENISEVTLQSDLNVNVININNVEPIGKSQAYSIIAEKLHDINDLDAYVFLDAKNYVESDFLSNVNFYLTKYQIFNPKVVYLPQDKNMTLAENIKSAYSRYITKFYEKARTNIGFTTILNSDAFVITKDLLNKIASFDFRDINSEMNYTFKLAKEEIKIPLVDDIRVYDSINKFNFRIPSLSQRFNLFRMNIFNVNNNISREFLISLIAPNWLMFAVSYFVLLKHAYRFPFWVSYSSLLITFLVLALSFFVSLLNTKLEPKEYLYLFAYPIYSLSRLLYNLPPVRWVRNILNKTTRQHVVEKMTTNIIVSDGKSDYSCKLELISEDGLAKVTFINRGKKYTTKNNHIRMVDAVRELTTKLSDYGLTLKACQCCKYFQPVIDGSTNMVKGVCNCQFQGRSPGDILPTLIWNTCPSFEQNNVVNLF